MVKSKTLYFLYLFIIAAFPFFISRYFYNVNDLPKSSALLILGSILVSLFLILFSYSIFKNKIDIIYFVPKLDIAILLFLLACILSTVFSLNPAESFRGSYERQVGLITFIYLTAIYFISAYIIKETHRVRTVVRIIEFISVVISLYAVLQFFKIELLDTESANSRPGSVLGNSVFLGGFLVLVLPFSVLNVSEKKNKFLVYFVPVIILIGIIISGTRSAYIALIVQIIIYVFIRLRNSGQPVKNRRTLFIIIILVVTVIAVLFFINQGMLYKRIIDVFQYNNPRFLLWSDAFNIFYKYPLTGPGISMFPAALEEFYSNTLRYADALVAYDHAHNNYLHILFTMGLAGLIAYLYLIFIVFRTAVKLPETGNNKKIKLAHAFIIMMGGYCFYGMTNFDDISILFYLFIMLSLLRASVSDIKEYTIRPKLKFAAYILSAAAILLCLINSKYVINYMSADVYFKEANVLYEKGEFVKALQSNNMAIELNPDCSAYRFVEASQVYNFCFENPGMNSTQKQKLLVQVEAELSKAKRNLYYINYCNGLLSLVYFEEGRIEEAEKLKNEVLVKDSININYRIKLTRYLLRENRLEEAKRNLNTILLIKPKEIVSWLLAAIYYNKINDSVNAVEYSKRVLDADPQNKTALDILNQYKK